MAVGAILRTANLPTSRPGLLPGLLPIQFLFPISYYFQSLPSFISLETWHTRKFSEAISQPARKGKNEVAGQGRRVVCMLSYPELERTRVVERLVDTGQGGGLWDPLVGDCQVVERHLRRSMNWGRLGKRRTAGVGGGLGGNRVMWTTCK